MKNSVRVRAGIRETAAILFSLVFSGVIIYNLITPNSI